MSDPKLEQLRQNYLFQTAQAVTFNYTDVKFLEITEGELLAQYEKLIPPEELTKIKQESDPVERILSLINAARKITLSEDPSSLGNREENLRLYTEEKKKQAEAQAEAEIAKKTSHPPHQWVKNYIQTVAKAYAKIDPEVTAYSLINDNHTPQTISQLASFVDSDSTPVATAIFMAPTITPLVENNLHPQITYVYETVESQIPDLPTLIPAANTFLKFSEPSATPREFRTLNHQLQVKIEAESGQVIDIPDSLSQAVGELNPNLPPDQLLSRSVAARLTKEGIPDPAAQQLMASLPLLYSISSYTPTQPSDTQEEVSHKKSQVFTSYAQIILSQYGFAGHKAQPNLDYHWVYMAAQNFYGPDQLYASQFKDLAPGNPFDNQITHFFADQGLGLVKSYVQDNYIQPLATEAFTKFAASGLGQSLGFGAKAATAVAGAEAGAATGATIGGPAAPVTALIGAIIGFLAAKSKDILSWLKKQSKNLIMLLGGGMAVLGGALGATLAGIAGLGIPGMVVAGGVGAVGFTALSGGSKALSSFASKATALSGELVGLAAVEIATPIIIIALSIPIVVALLLFIINTSALVVPPNPYGVQTVPNFIPPGEAIECTTAEKPLSFRYDANPTASAAWSIVNKLKQGFWCYWNNSPDYPELFDQAEYQKYPYHCVYEPNNPPNCSGDYRSIGGYSMFWCTWLVRKVYPTSPPFTNLELGANNMKENWFKSSGKYTPNTSGVVKKITPGDTIFIRTARDSGDYAGHVAVVYVVSQDFVFTLDSNASAKTHSYTVSTDGSVQGLPGLTVLGFGKLN